jgi:hypothetical protein
LFRSVEQNKLVAYIDAIKKLDREPMEWKTSSGRCPEEPKRILVFNPQLTDEQGEEFGRLVAPPDQEDVSLAGRKPDGLSHLKP